jgi:hypothetical protein
MESPRDHKGHLHGALIDFTMTSRLTCMFLRLDLRGIILRNDFLGLPLDEGRSVFKVL